MPSPHNTPFPGHTGGASSTPAQVVGPGAGGPPTVAGPSGAPKRTRSERVAAVVAKPSLFRRLWKEAKADNNLWSFFIMLATVGCICTVIRAWNPPLGFRSHTFVSRNVVCSTPFSIPSEQGQRDAETQVRAKVKHYFVNDPQPLVQLRDSLRNTVASLIIAKNYDELTPKDKREWLRFLPPPGTAGTVGLATTAPHPGERAIIAAKTEPSQTEPSQTEPSRMSPTPQTEFERFLAQMNAKFSNFDLFASALTRSFAPMEAQGLLKQLDFTAIDGDQQQILVYLKGTDYQLAEPAFVDQVQIADGTRVLRALANELQDQDLAQYLFQWIRPQLSVTLTEDKENTNRLRQEMLAGLPEVRKEYLPGEPLVEAGRYIGSFEMHLLQAEYLESLKNRSYDAKVARFGAVFLLLALFFFLGWAFAYRRERRKPKSLRGTALLFLSLFLTVTFGHILQRWSTEFGQWELVPLLLFVQCVAIMFSWELSIVLASNLVIALTIPDGTGIGQPLILLAVVISATTQLGRLRTRTKLIIVGFIGGFCAILITLAAGFTQGRLSDVYLFREAAFNFLWPVVAAFIMTGLIPFIERPFGIVTDMSLLELVDVSHPLLQELIRRAPATYSHSMQVGTVAEAAADAIGARGLMTRVGAYFHDIGKIFKPEYFAENQGDAVNVHNTLEPRMSTLIIVAHVKDGVDLARQHRLPQPLIDLIEQHHGTSLVSFFYGRAARQSKESGHGDHIEEGSFRYPGPKPRSKEAGILMLADASESACRSFDGNSPGKIESMVRQITKSKLDDGQFDDCGMTLKELRTVENSIINSLIAIKHGRIRYPGQDAVEAHGEQLDRDRLSQVQQRNVS